MAKVKLGNVKGPQGEQGVRGSKWYNTDKITGESTSGTAFPGSGIADAMVGDMALNPTTLNLYTCQTAGNAATAKWVFMACIKGPQGAKGDKGDPTTVDAALSKDSANPIQNKAVATKFQDVQDSLGLAPFVAYAGTALNNLTHGWTVYYDITPNRPSPYGIVCAVADNQFDWIFQIAFSTYGDIYTRMKINKDEWTQWVQR